MSEFRGVAQDGYPFAYQFVATGEVNAKLDSVSIPIGSLEISGNQLIIEIGNSRIPYSQDQLADEFVADLLRSGLTNDPDLATEIADILSDVMDVAKQAEENFTDEAIVDALRPFLGDWPGSNFPANFEEATYLFLDGQNSQEFITVLADNAVRHDIISNGVLQSTTYISGDIEPNAGGDVNDFLRSLPSFSVSAFFEELRSYRYEGDLFFTGAGQVDPSDIEYLSESAPTQNGTFGGDVYVIPKGLAGDVSGLAGDDNISGGDLADSGAADHEQYQVC